MGEREILADNNQDNLTDGSKSASSCSDQNGNLNGTGNDFKACMASTAAARPPDLDYLTQLLKDKKQLAAFSNIFSHVERLLDDEISRVRVALFQCKFAREPLQLPEPVGEIILRQEKIFVPTKSHPDFNFVGRILGPRGMTAKQLESETGCKIMVRGKGSIRDKKKEDMNRGKANWEHLQEELHVLIQSEDTPNRNEVKIKRAVEEVNKLLVPSPEGEDELKKKQLMELAIINGTFRNGTLIGATPAQSPSSATTLGQFVVAPGFDQRLLAQQQNLNFSLTGLNGTVPGIMANSAALQSPALAGAPLIMQQATVSPQQQMALRSKADATQNGLLSISFGASPAACGLANSQLTALAQAQAAAFQLQQLQQGAGTSLMSANGVNGALAPAFAQLPAATSAAATAAIAAQQQQQALNYQQLLLNSSQSDPNAMAIQLAQLQQQHQQQQLHQQQQQLAALMQVSGASGAASFNAASDSISAISALPYATLNDGCGTPTGGYGSASNNNSRSRRFIGQSRDHPYGKRE